MATFTEKWNTAVETVDEAAKVPTNAPVFNGEPVDIDANDPGEDYVALTTKLKLRQPSLDKVQFRRFLQREEIVVYDNQAVNSYLEERKAWMQENRPERYGYTVEWLPLAIGDRSYEGSRVYDQAVPIEALQVADKVMSGFGASHELTWEVSQIKKDPDPFLACSFRGERYVLAHWDEPGFSVVRATESTDHSVEEDEDDLAF